MPGTIPKKTRILYFSGAGNDHGFMHFLSDPKLGGPNQLGPTRDSVLHGDERAAAARAENFQEKNSDEPRRGKHGNVICRCLTPEHISQDLSQNRRKFETMPCEGGYEHIVMVRKSPQIKLTVRGKGVHTNI